MSQPKISRLENGIGLPDPEDVGRIARALGASDDEIYQLVSLAELSHNRMTDFRLMPAALAAQQRAVAELESQARSVRAFEPTVVIGLLQTSEYARAILSAFKPLATPLDTEPAAVPEALSARVKRQEILADPTRDFHFLMAETVLSNRFCPPDEMAGQVRRLRHLARQDNVSISIIPAAARWRVPPIHGFFLLDDSTVGVDLFNTALTSQGKMDAKAYRQIFDWYEEEAVTDIDPILDRHLERYLELMRTTDRAYRG